LNKSPTDPKFIFREIDLINDPKFAGRNSIKWALNVACFVFTEEELKLNVLEKSSRTNRTALDQSGFDLSEVTLVVKNNRFFLTLVFTLLFLDALIHKYHYNSEKLDKVWTIFRDRLNNKGRNIKKKANESFITRMNNDGSLSD